MNEQDDGPFAVRVGEHTNWTIEATPELVGGKWRANASASREPTEDGDDLGDSFQFLDLGDFESQAEAAERAVHWVTRWIEINY
jgi:hypothetical protein